MNHTWIKINSVFTDGLLCLETGTTIARSVSHVEEATGKTYSRISYMNSDGKEIYSFAIPEDEAIELMSKIAIRTKAI